MATRPLRTRLTLWTVLVGGLSVALFGAVVGFSLKAVMLRQFDATLRQEADSLLEALDRTTEPGKWIGQKDITKLFSSVISLYSFEIERPPGKSVYRTKGLGRAAIPGGADGIPYTATIGDVQSARILQLTKEKTRLRVALDLSPLQHWEKSMWWTGRFLLSRGSTEGESTPSKRSPRPSSARTQDSDRVGQSSGNAPLAIVRPVRRRSRSTNGSDWIFSRSSISISLVRLETSTTMAGPKKASSDSSCEPDHPSRTWSGASACVPTCGLELNDETLTLAPAPINEAHPQVNGVSPGHSGVSGLRVTLMSRSVGSLPFTRSLCEGVWVT